MKHTSPTLLIIAALAAAPGVHALSVKDDDVKLGLAMQLQVRADWSDAVAADGDTEYGIHEANTGGTSDPVDFYVRRMRVGFKGTWKDSYKFAAMIRIDGQDRTAGGADRTAQAHVAVLEKVWKDEEAKIEHSFRAGMDYAFFNGASGVFSSSGFLFPSARATEQSAMLAPRGGGIGYKLDTEIITWGVDIQNNVNDDDDTDGDGLFYGTRVHLTPPGEMGIKKPTESFLGKEGTGVMTSLEYGVNTRADSNVNTTAYGVELLAHVDGLTALAEFRAADVEDMAAETEVKRQIWLVQAGYALPMGDAIIEPALRYTSIDLDKDVDSTDPYGSGVDYGTSGTQYEVGVNYYIHGHSNKVQVMYQGWSAEEEDAEAKILRAQWQISF